jgi:MerR family redox-sensitive transcriptional activator SoxR
MTTVALETRPELTVGELARASGVAPSAVRFYEKHGLVTSERTSGNQRRFYEVEACLIKIIRVAQRSACRWPRSAG